MSIQLEWFGLAEGSTEDSRGALTLVGVNQNIIQAREFPVNVKRQFVILTGEDEGFEDLTDRRIHVTVEVTSPSGELVASAKQVVNIHGKRRKEIPGSLQLVGAMNFEVGEVGAYLAACIVEDSRGEFRLEGSKKFYVIEG